MLWKFINLNSNINYNINKSIFFKNNRKFDDVEVENKIL